MFDRRFLICLAQVFATLLGIASFGTSQNQAGYRPLRSPAVEINDLLALLPGPDTSEILEAIDRVSRLKADEVSSALIEYAFSSDRESIREAAAAVVSSKAVPRDQPDLIAGLDAPIPERREACAAALRGFVSAESRRALLEHLVFEQSPDVRLAILESLVDVGVGGEGDRIVSFLGSGEPDVVLATIRALGNGARPEQASTVSRFLAHADWRYRLAALDTIERCLCVDLVGEIIEAIPGSNARILGAIHGVLTTLTAREIGPDPSKWSKDIHEGRKIDVSRTATSTEETFRRRKFAGGRNSVRHFAVEAPTDSVFFVVDVSDSMDLRADRGRSQRSPLECVVAELERTLSALQPTCRFNILAFGGDSVLWAEESVSASKEAVESARAWLRVFVEGGEQAEKQRPGPLTNIDGALTTAHGYPAPTPERPEVEIFATDVPIADTLFFYSDGNANRGVYKSTAGLLGRLRSLHDATMITIHTVVPECRFVNVDLMRGIAELTGGEVTYLDREGQPISRDVFDARQLEEPRAGRRR